MLGYASKYFSKDVLIKCHSGKMSKLDAIAIGNEFAKFVKKEMGSSKAGFGRSKVGVRAEDLI